MIWLAMLPWRWIGLAAAVLALGVGVWGHGSSHGFKKGDAGRIAVQAVLERERLDATQRMAEAQASARAEEERRDAAQRRISDELATVQAKARADAADAADAAGRLQLRIAALLAAVSRRGGTPDTAAAGAPADDPAGMLADVLGRCIAHARFLAAIADERGAAGRACEQSYDALTTDE